MGIIRLAAATDGSFDIPWSGRPPDLRTPLQSLPHEPPHRPRHTSPFPILEQAQFSRHSCQNAAIGVLSPGIDESGDQQSKEIGARDDKDIIQLRLV